MFYFKTNNNSEKKVYFNDESGILKLSLIHGHLFSLQPNERLKVFNLGSPASIAYHKGVAVAIVNTIKYDLSIASPIKPEVALLKANSSISSLVTISNEVSFNNSTNTLDTEDIIETATNRFEKLILDRFFQGDSDQTFTIKRDEIHLRVIDNIYPEMSKEEIKIIKDNVKYFHSGVNTTLTLKN